MSLALLPQTGAPQRQQQHRSHHRCALLSISTDPGKLLVPVSGSSSSSDPTQNPIVAKVVLSLDLLNPDKSSAMQLALEGSVEHKFHMEPHSGNFGEYGKLFCDRTNKSMIKTRQVQVHYVPIGHELHAHGCQQLNRIQAAEGNHYVQEAYAVQPRSAYVSMPSLTNNRCEQQLQQIRSNLAAKLDYAPLTLWTNQNSSLHPSGVLVCCSKNLEIKKINEEKNVALSGQFAADVTLQRFQAAQKDDKMPPIEAILAPLEAEQKLSFVENKFML